MSARDSYPAHSLPGTVPPWVALDAPVYDAAMDRIDELEAALEDVVRAATHIRTRLIVDLPVGPLAGSLPDPRAVADSLAVHDPDRDADVVWPDIKDYPREEHTDG